MQGKLMETEHLLLDPRLNSMTTFVKFAEPQRTALSDLSGAISAQ
jgi:hypothetical protein